MGCGLFAPLFRIHSLLPLSASLGCSCVFVLSLQGLKIFTLCPGWCLSAVVGGSRWTLCKNFELSQYSRTVGRPHSHCTLCALFETGEQQKNVINCFGTFSALLWDIIESVWYLSSEPFSILFRDLFRTLFFICFQMFL